MADRTAASLFRPRTLLAALLALGTAPVLWAGDPGNLQPQRARNACDLEVSDVNYCKECGPCGQGEGRCVTDDECLPGFVCAEDFGAAFGFAPTHDVCIAPGSIPPSYSVVELPSVEVNGYLLDDVEPWGINNAGQVVGQASSSDYANYRSVAFRFGLDTGMEVLDPGGGQRSAGRMINENGDVFGIFLHPGTSLPKTSFVYRDGQGFNRLKLGADPAIRRFFVISDMNDNGDLLGHVFRASENRAVAYLFTFEDGWQSLEALAPGLPRLSATGGRINNRGDMVFGGCTYGGTCPLYLWRGGKLVELNAGGFQTHASDLNDRGDVVGATYTKDYRGHAYLYQAGKGRLIDLEPQTYHESRGVVVTRKGVVAGEMAEGSGIDTLFTYDRRRQEVRQLVARKADFEVLVPPGRAFDRIYTVFANERLELVGLVYTRKSREKAGPNRWFYFSPPLGVLGIQEMVTAAGSTRTVSTVRGLNDRGAILVTYLEDQGQGQRTRSLVLVPDGF